MITVLYKLPVPSSSGLEGAVEVRPGRSAVLKCDDGGGSFVTLTFPRVMAYRVTYHTACTLFMISNAYDKLVDVGRSDWLESVEKNIADQREKIEGLRHFMIYFDDGPCFEFIGTSFNVESNFPETIPPEPWLQPT